MVTLWLLKWFFQIVDTCSTFNMELNCRWFLEIHEVDRKKTVEIILYPILTWSYWHGVKWKVVFPCIYKYIHVFIYIYIYPLIYIYIYIIYILYILIVFVPYIHTTHHLYYLSIKIISIVYLFVILHNQWWCQLKTALLPPVVKVQCSL